MAIPVGMNIPEQIRPFVQDDSSQGRSKLQKIFQIAGDKVLLDTSLSLSEEQRKLIRDIRNCRTINCGFNLEVCTECGCKKIHYNSCGNRNCSICNRLKKEIWIDERSSEVIDAAYYHAVFTAPHELNPLFLANKKLLFALLHKCVGETIVELANDEKYLGATPGIIQILHTWNQKLLFHPHIHAVISGGGLAKNRTLKTLKQNTFFIAENILVAKFRGKFLACLEELHRSGSLLFPDSLKHLRSPGKWSLFRDTLYRQKWVVFIKETFNGKGNAIEYLGRYANKVAITDSRILSVTEDAVTFSVRGSDGKQSEKVTVTPEEFIKRYLLHVLPKGFQKIRYYGYLNNRYRKNNLVLIFNLQGYQKFLRKYAGMNSAQIIMKRWGHDVRVCRHCLARSLLTVYSTRTCQFPGS